MASAINKLNALKVKNTNKPGVYGDGNNLFLQVASKGGAKSWIFRYASKADGKTKAVGLGSINSTSLTAARLKAQELRRMITEGKDPATELNRAKAAVQAMLTFDQAAGQFIADKSGEWSNPKHKAQWEATLKTYASPIIGDVAVDAIDTHHILKILRPIWSTKTETASRVRGRIESVLSWAKSNKLRSGENPAMWHGHLQHQLTAPSKTATVRHHPSLPWQSLPAFMAALKQREGMGAKALEFTILCASRSGEVRGATWSEIDLTSRTWTIPAERMKAKTEHAVPLSDASLALLQALPRFKGTDLIFPSSRKTPLSDMTLSALIRRMNEGDTPLWVDKRGEAVVVHGFRSTFRIWAAESTNIPRDVAEHALAHKLPDAVEAAYQRSTLFEKRIELMRQWATWATSTPGNVVPMLRKEAA